MTKSEWKEYSYTIKVKDSHNKLVIEKTTWSEVDMEGCFISFTAQYPKPEFSIELFKNTKEKITFA